MRSGWVIKIEDPITKNKIYKLTKKSRKDINKIREQFSNIFISSYYSEAIENNRSQLIINKNNNFEVKEILNDHAHLDPLLISSNDDNLILEITTIKCN